MGVRDARGEWGRGPGDGAVQWAGFSHSLGCPVLGLRLTTAAGQESEDSLGSIREDTVILKAT